MSGVKPFLGKCKINKIRGRYKAQKETSYTLIMKGWKPRSLNFTFIHPSVGRYHTPSDTLCRPVCWGQNSFCLYVEGTPISAHFPHATAFWVFLHILWIKSGSAPPPSTDPVPSWLLKGLQLLLDIVVPIFSSLEDSLCPLSALPLRVSSLWFIHISNHQIITEHLPHITLYIPCGQWIRWL